jgi:heme/copper-type cytochrome/quinol oxidase subunit 2
MVLGIEIAMLVMGIITLFKGQIKLSKNRLVTGLPAYIIGIILAGTVPLIMVIGFVIGFNAAMNANGRPVDLSKYFYIDLIVVPASVLIVCIIAFLSPNGMDKKQTPPSDVFPQNNPPLDLPPMGDNPYASPQTDIKNPRQ